MNRLPYEIREAMVTVLGKVFWLKDPFKAFLLAAGVPREVVDRYAEEPKFKIARHVLAELDAQGDEGWLIQRRLLSELCRLRSIPDPTVEDKDGALNALRQLKELAAAQALFVEEERSTAQTRAREAQVRQAALAARAEKMESLRRRFAEMAASRDDPQMRGYGLEDLIGDLCDVHEVPYRPPYRTASEQIDGSLQFGGFDYLLETRWRISYPELGDLMAFKGKVDRKLESTRGLFFSIAAYRTEVVMDFMRGGATNVVLFDGSDIALILEGQISFTDALQIKIEKAAQEGVIYFPLTQR